MVLVFIHIADESAGNRPYCSGAEARKDHCLGNWITTAI